MGSGYFQKRFIFLFIISFQVFIIGELHLPFPQSHARFTFNQSLGCHSGRNLADFRQPSFLFSPASYLSFVFIFGGLLLILSLNVAYKTKSLAGIGVIGLVHVCGMDRAGT